MAKPEALIAVVDDEPTWLGTLGRALSREGYHALLIGDPTLAAEQIRREDPAAVILDHRMPELSGIELAHQLSALLGDACPPLILVTGDVEALDRAAAAPFVAAYEKPLSLERLMAELRRVLRGRKASGVLRPVGLDEADDEKTTTLESG